MTGKPASVSTQGTRIVDPWEASISTILSTAVGMFRAAKTQYDACCETVNKSAVAIAERRKEALTAKEMLDSIRYRLVLDTDFDKILNKRTNEAERTAHLATVMSQRQDCNIWKEKLEKAEEEIETHRRAIEFATLQLRGRMEEMRHATAILEAFGNGRDHIGAVPRL